MSAFIWLFAAVNLLIGCYNSFVSGAMWGSLDTLRGRVLPAGGLLAGFIGVGYAFVLVAVGLGYASTDLVLATNVIVGLPMIVLGALFAADAWNQYRRTGSKWAAAVAVWNTAATFWNIAIYIRSFKEIGGFSGAAKEVGKNSHLAIAGAVLFSAVVSYGMFTLGRRTATEAKA